MRTSSFIIFFSIVLVLYTLINYYIFRRGLQAIPKESILRTFYIVFFILISGSYLIGRILERYTHTLISEILVKVGSFWLAAMIYFLLIVLLLDLLRLFNHIIPFYPAIIKNYYSSIKKYIFVFSFVVVSVVLFFGYLNALNPKLKKIDINISKKVDGLKNLKMVIISDVHLGTIIGRERFSYIVDEINKQAPDIVLIVGDLVDESIGPVVNDNIGKCIERLNTRYGVYAVTGNHEFIGGAEPAINYFQSHGLIFLRDSFKIIDGKFVLIGREDRVKQRFTGVDRKPLKEIISEIDKQLPLILMDHQPLAIEETIANKIDLQLSGHTHHGQLFPFNYITDRIYEVSWGYKQIGNTHIYVSSGVGTWGPPVRIGNYPEIVLMNLIFN